MHHISSVRFSTCGRPKWWHCRFIRFRNEKINLTLGWQRAYGQVHHIWVSLLFIWKDYENVFLNICCFIQFSSQWKWWMLFCGQCGWCFGHWMGTGSRIWSYWIRLEHAGWYESCETKIGKPNFEWMTSNTVFLLNAYSFLFNCQLQICGSYEKQSVVVHAINLDHVIPFYNPTNIPFKHNQSTRKSFNRGTPKTKIVLKANNASGNNNNDPRSGSLTSGKEMSSPSSLSFEMIEESIDETPLPPHTASKNEYAFENLARTRENSMFSLPADNYNGYLDEYSTALPPDDGGMYFDNSSNDLDFYPERIMEPDREDFPVNNAQPPDYAPKMDLIHNTNVYNNAPKVVNKSKIVPVPPRKTLSQQSNARSSLAMSKKFSTSNIDLHSIDDSASSFGGTNKKNFSSRNGSPTRNYTAFNNNNNLKAKRSDAAPKETNHARKNRNITVQILAKPPPPPRSKTSLDLKANSSLLSNNSSMGTSSLLQSGVTSMLPIPSKSTSFSNAGSYNGHASVEENAEISVLTAYHERVYQQLSTRYATLQLVRNSTR